MNAYLLNPILMICILLFSFQLRANNIHGTLMVVKGDVNIEASKDKKGVKARIGSKIFEGDTIVTGKDSRAKIVMLDKNVINISPDSRFQIEKYVYKPEANQKSALLNVIYGKVRTTVNQKYDTDKNTFQVKTKSSVAGVRGTDFVVQFNATTETTKVVTFEGHVEVGSGLDNTGRILNSVMVDPGQFTVTAPNTPPAVPLVLPKAELAALESQTVADTPTTSQDGEPAQDGEKKEGDKKSSPTKDKGDGPREPNAVSGSQGPAAPGTGAAILDQMGENSSSPLSDNFAPPPLLTQAPGNFCPPSGCSGPINSIDPTLFQGKSNVIIQLSPTNP